ncbi:MAG: hypothetical protein MUP21_08325, partial [Dehalococcoidia bacterium]|nr:hypothetical protein [Dehalococcoidia bacterium]
FVEMPHYLFASDYYEVRKCAQHCKSYMTLMRYIDLGEAISFIQIVNKEFPEAIYRQDESERSPQVVLRKL